MDNELESQRIEKQIAALLEKKAAVQLKERAREKVERVKRANVLVDTSPVKKKNVSAHQHVLYDQVPIKQPIFTSNRLTTTHLPQAGPSTLPTSSAQPQPPAPQPSISRLSSALYRSRRDDDPANHDDAQADPSSISARGKKRDEVDMTIMQDLTLGPKEFGKDHLGTAEWRFFEPNSGINLKERIMSHHQVQNHLADRYILSPSEIYSAMRLSSDKQHYTMPIDAGWVVIGVVCHKGEIKVTQGRRRGEDDKDGDGSENEGQGGFDPDDGPDKRQKLGGPKGNKSKKVKSNAPPAKFITIRICSLPSRSQLTSASSGGGDAILNVMLFESDYDETLPSAHGEPVVKKYKGGSGGAFEMWWKLTVGAVVGIISPKILKPFGAGNKGPHPLTHPVGLTPSSADDIFLIGRSRDLGTCASIKRDGKQCTEWVDLRVHQHCEFHVVGAIKQIRGGRAEFSGSTGGFELAMKASMPMYRRGKGGADEAKHGKEWRTRNQSENRILPKRGFDDGTGQTYIVGGRAISERKSQKFADEHVVERMGREKQTSLKRKTEAAAKEKELDQLMSQDNGTTGAKYLEAANKLRGDDQQDRRTLERAAADRGLADKLKPRPFHASAIKLIGFDPTTAQNEGGLMVEKGEQGRRRLEAIASLRSNARPAARLGNMAGFKSKSNASIPNKQQPAVDTNDEEPMIDLTDSESE